MSWGSWVPTLISRWQRATTDLSRFSLYCWYVKVVYVNVRRGTPGKQPRESHIIVVHKYETKLLRSGDLYRNALTSATNFESQSHVFSSWDLRMQDWDSDEAALDDGQQELWLVHLLVHRRVDTVTEAPGDKALVAEGQGSFFFSYFLREQQASADWTFCSSTNMRTQCVHTWRDCTTMRSLCLFVPFNGIIFALHFLVLSPLLPSIMVVPT